MRNFGPLKIQKIATKARLVENRHSFRKSDSSQLVNLAFVSSVRAHVFQFVTRVCFSTVLPSSGRSSFFPRAIATLPRFCKAFPPLLRDSISLLLQLQRTTHAAIAATNSHFDGDAEGSGDQSAYPAFELYCNVRKTFHMIAEQCWS